MRSKTAAIVAGIILVAVAVSCAVSLSIYFSVRAKRRHARSSAPGEDGTSGNVSGAVSLNRLALGLFSRAALGRPNVFLSPVSIAAALGMLKAGATPKSRTERELAALVGNDINLSSSVGSIRDDPSEGIRLVVANSLWVNKQFVKKSYQDEIEIDYAADVKNIPKDVSEVNDWVKAKTQGAIDRVLSNVPQDAVALIVNAFLFKGSWRDAFDEADTASAPFASNGTSLVHVSMMTRRSAPVWYASVPLGTNCQTQVIEIPYGAANSSSRGNGTDQFTAILVLPCEGRALDTVVMELRDAQVWDSWMNKLSLTPTIASFLSVPKFKLSTPPLGYKKVLMELGVKAAFLGENGGGFSKLTANTTILVTDVVHTGNIEVNEKGTTAAAASGLIVTTKSGAPAEIPPIIFNRSFIFAVRNKKSSAIIFIGRVDDPSVTA
jgi:serpin B